MRRLESVKNALADSALLDRLSFSATVLLL